ncbi:Spy/CpxP family protein refolding chaperone [Methylobacillus gramineus]|uniref:Spy/CpxP family protein refolding chaperone n=1 Tax=Methylobacillus gramineus TaxID=755169 RepID=UPI001CFFFFC5|nr:Spy/CpxP family protein refolding chaperone [Methylobacillus gramineus]MCB5184949.1 Spy/CpxP family protein refolding chaperone [Methylobacillus gramineus]
MIRTRKLLVSSAILASSLLAMNIAASHAESGDQKCDKYKKHVSFDGRHGFSEGRFLEHKLRPLNLSTEQQAQVKQIFEKQKPVFAEKRQAIHDAYKALAAASSSERYDEKNVQQLASQQANIQADLIVLRTSTLHEVYKVLTPEQQKKWAEYESKVKARHAEKA